MSYEDDPMNGGGGRPDDAGQNTGFYGPGQGPQGQGQAQPRTNPNDVNREWAKKVMGESYKTNLGRELHNDEAESLLGQNWNMKWLQDHLNWIPNSPEAKAYRAKPPTPPPPPAPPPPGSGSPEKQAQVSQQTQQVGSPVTANGQINPQAAAPAVPAQNGATPNELRYVKPVDLSTVGKYQPFQYSQAPAPAQFSQYNQVDQGQTQGQENALMSAVLNNPQTMSPEVVAQMKEKAKQQALLMQQQGQQQYDQGAVARGTLGSGRGDAFRQGLQNDTVSNLLNNFRDTDIAAASTNRQDQLNAIAAAEQMQTGQIGRATNQYGAQLSGQSAQANNALQQAVQQFQTQQGQAGENFKANQSEIDRMLNQFNVNNGLATNAQQNYGADLSTELGRNSQLLEQLKFGENKRQFNGTLGFQYAGLDQQSQIALTNLLRQLGIL